MLGYKMGMPEAADETHAQDTSAPAPRVRRWPRVLAMIIAGLFLLAVVASGVIGGMFRARMAAAVKQATGADLEVADSWYLPPLGVSLHGVRVVKTGPAGSRTELFTAARVVLKLSRRPKKGEPVLIRRLAISAPYIRIIREAASGAPGAAISDAPRTIPSGSATESSPAASPGSVASRPVARAAAPRVSLSSKFRLERLDISDGQITYEDRIGEHGAPVVLDNIHGQITPRSSNGADYDFQVQADDPGRAHFISAGAMNIDQALLSVAKFQLSAHLAALAEQLPMPQAWRLSTSANATNGTLKVHASASVPLRDFRHAVYRGTLSLENARTILPKVHLTVPRADAVFSFHNLREGDHPGAVAQVERLDLAVVHTLFHLDGGTFSAMGREGGWKLAALQGRLDVQDGVPALDAMRLHGRWTFTAAAGGPWNFRKLPSPIDVIRPRVVAYPRDVSVQPRLFPLPVEHINGGPVELLGGVIRMQNLIADYGGDKVLLDSARITLDDPRQQARWRDLSRQVKVEGITGAVVFQQPGPRWPAGLGAVIAQLRPVGTFAVGGESWYAINRRLPGEMLKPKPDYFFRVSTAGGAFALTSHKIPVTDIHGDATVSPMLINVTRFRGRALDGLMDADAKITPSLPVRYQGNLGLYNIDLAKLSADFDLREGTRGPVRGKGFLKTRVAGAGRNGAIPPMNSLTAAGEFEVIDGNFGTLTTVRAAADKVAKPDDPLDGQAAGVFSIKDRVVTLKRAAIGNPTFGLQGSGTITFDKRLNLHVVAAPLGDWGDALRQSNIPIIDGIASNIAGAIQQVFNGAQRVFLWDIRIEGTTSAPKVQTTPAPVITEPVAALFSQMLGGKKDQHLIDAIRPPDTQPAPGKK